MWKRNGFLSFNETLPFFSVFAPLLPKSERPPMFRLAFALLCFAVAANALTVKVESKTEECFIEEATKGQTLTLQFQVMAGGLLDIDTTLHGPNDEILKHWTAATEGKHTWTAEHDAKYKFCFSNMMARWTPKWLSFFISSGATAHLAKIEHLDPIEKVIMDLSEGLSKLQEEQKYLRTVERVHRETIESTNTRMLYWSLFEVLVLIAMGMFQIYYLKRFLEVRSSV